MLKMLMIIQNQSCTCQDVNLFPAVVEVARPGEGEDKGGEGFTDFFDFDDMYKIH